MLPKVASALTKFIAPVSAAKSATSDDGADRREQQLAQYVHPLQKAGESEEDENNPNQQGQDQDRLDGESEETEPPFERQMNFDDPNGANVQIQHKPSTPPAAQSTAKSTPSQPPLGANAGDVTSVAQTFLKLFSNVRENHEDLRGWVGVKQYKRSLKNKKKIASSRTGIIMDEKVE